MEYLGYAQVQRIYLNLRVRTFKVNIVLIFENKMDLNFCKTWEKHKELRIGVNAKYGE